MEATAAKCYICDVECPSEDKFLGTNISRTLTMSMTAILEKCLRIIVETENEYFCGECTHKIEEYDQLIQLSVQIETELYELFQKKPTEPCYLLDAEIISDSNSINNILIETDEIKQIIKTDEVEEISGTYDEMVIEYLDEFETQSEGTELLLDQNQVIVDVKEETNIIEIDDKSKIQKHSSPRKAKVNDKNRVNKKKGIKMETPEDKDIVLNCQQCSFVAETREELEEHKTINHIDEIKRLVCDICGRSYKSKSALCVHLGMHNGRNAHECHICGKTFTQRGALVRHMPMHTGEKPHQCDVCGKRFIHYSSFHMHQMIHTNERKKKCPFAECGAEFRSNSHMNRHLRSHTGEKPYPCEICGQRFAQRYNMKTHYNTHRGIHRPSSKNHKCLICNEAFPRREKLNSHLRLQHRVSDDDIKSILEHGPDSKVTKDILDRLKVNLYTTDDEFIEYINDIPGELITKAPLT